MIKPGELIGVMDMRGISGCAVGSVSQPDKMKLGIANAT
jgi:hypothetical protein